MHVLQVEDEPDMAHVVETYLRREGFDVTTAPTVSQMRETLAARGADLVLLDIRLPDESGWDALRWIRQQGDLPVIVLTTEAEAIDKVAGLEMGADDYLPKPVLLRELAARIRSVLRRAASARSPATRSENPAPVAFKGWSLDLRSQRLMARDGTPVHLSDIEYRILAQLALAPFKAVTRDHLSTTALGRPWNPTDRSIDVHVATLRRKLADIVDAGEIRTIRSAGYMLVPET